MSKQPTPRPPRHVLMPPHLPIKIRPPPRNDATLPHRPLARGRPAACRDPAVGRHHNRGDRRVRGGRTVVRKRWRATTARTAWVRAPTAIGPTQAIKGPKSPVVCPGIGHGLHTIQAVKATKTTKTTKNTVFGKRCSCSFFSRRAAILPSKRWPSIAPLPRHALYAHFPLNPNEDGARRRRSGSNSQPYLPGKTAMDPVSET